MQARQIGRDVRHTSDCKVTDVVLQDYFQTLTTLLTDSTFLAQDRSASQAVTKLLQVKPVYVHNGLRLKFFLGVVMNCDVLNTRCRQSLMKMFCPLVLISWLTSSPISTLNKYLYYAVKIYVTQWKGMKENRVLQCMYALYIKLSVRRRLFI